LFIVTPGEALAENELIGVIWRKRSTKGEAQKDVDAKETGQGEGEYRHGARSFSLVVHVDFHRRHDNR
jgi:hypothetical protein